MTLKQNIEFHLKAWFKVSAIIWVLYVGYGIIFHNNDTDPFAMEVIKIGGTLITWWFWFYLVPKIAFKIIKILYGTTASVVEQSLPHSK